MLGLNAEVLGPDERSKAIKYAVLASSTFVNAVESLHAELEAAKLSCTSATAAFHEATSAEAALRVGPGTQTR